MRLPRAICWVMLLTMCSVLLGAVWIWAQWPVWIADEFIGLVRAGEFAQAADFFDGDCSFCVDRTWCLIAVHSASFGYGAVQNCAALGVAGREWLLLHDGAASWGQDEARPGVPPLVLDLFYLSQRADRLAENAARRSGSPPSATKVREINHEELRRGIPGFLLPPEAWRAWFAPEHIDHLPRTPRDYFVGQCRFRTVEGELEFEIRRGKVALKTGRTEFKKFLESRQYRPIFDEPAGTLYSPLSQRYNRATGEEELVFFGPTPAEPTSPK